MTVITTSSSTKVKPVPWGGIVRGVLELTSYLDGGLVASFRSQLSVRASVDPGIPKMSAWASAATRLT